MMHEMNTIKPKKPTVRRKGKKKRLEIKGEEEVLTRGVVVGAVGGGGDTLPDGEDEV